MARASVGLTLVCAVTVDETDESNVNAQAIDLGLDSVIRIPELRYKGCCRLRPRFVKIATFRGLAAASGSACQRPAPNNWTRVAEQYPVQHSG